MRSSSEAVKQPAFLPFPLFHHGRSKKLNDSFNFIISYRLPIFCHYSTIETRLVLSAKNREKKRQLFFSFHCSLHFNADVPSVKKVCTLHVFTLQKLSTCAKCEEKIKNTDDIFTVADVLSVGLPKDYSRAFERSCSLAFVHFFSCSHLLLILTNFFCCSIKVACQVTRPTTFFVCCQYDLMVINLF